jgi:Fungal Zn(2)-Cys(6) binuclear cluster domain
MSHLRGTTQLPDGRSSESSHDPPTQHLSNQTSENARAVAQPSSSQTASSQSPRVRRRNRIITSCLECRRRKLKCDKLHPCTNCTKFVRDCVFLAPALNSASQLKLAEIKEKMGRLERGLADEVANAKQEARLPSNPGEPSHEKVNQETDAQHIAKVGIDLPGDLSPEQSDGDDNSHVLEDEKCLEPTPLAVLEAAYEDKEEHADDDMLDLGVKMGKMRYVSKSLMNTKYIIS